jgi:hypothetical protein
MVRPVEPDEAAERVRRYVEGYRQHRHLDQEEAHSVAVGDDAEPRPLRPADLEALLVEREQMAAALADIIQDSEQPALYTSGRRVAHGPLAPAEKRQRDAWARAHALLRLGDDD